ncbi:hypothetical protein NL676_021210 [Syzygium grande]|nr:hypothetical protein NL676_021210 [Syzygium grande]
MSSKHLLLLILSLVVALAAPALAEYAMPPEHGKHKPHHHGAMPPAWAPHHGHKPHHHGAMPPAWAPHHGHRPHHKPGAPGPMPELLEKPFPGHHHPPAHAPFPHHGHHPAHGRSRTTDTTTTERTRQWRVARALTSRTCRMRQPPVIPTEFLNV